jgi:SAM-dependent methyltransferase
MTTSVSSLSERDRAEVLRSAAEAKRTNLEQTGLERYLSPPENTAYSLEYAFYLLGDVRGKTVLDVGCGSGENMVPLANRGANVIGIDISQELIELAVARFANVKLHAKVRVGSAYQTGLPDGCVDAIFCMSIIHHLDIEVVREEMRRVLAPNGRIIFKEPVRFSETYRRLRQLLPEHGDNSEYEHPLTRAELDTLTQGFRVEKMRYFRLPMVPLTERLLGRPSYGAWKASNRILRSLPFLQTFATVCVGRLAA